LDGEQRRELRRRLCKCIHIMYNTFIRDYYDGNFLLKWESRGGAFQFIPAFRIFPLKATKAKEYVISASNKYRKQKEIKN